MCLILGCCPEPCEGVTGYTPVLSEIWKTEFLNSLGPRALATARCTQETHSEIAGYLPGPSWVAVPIPAPCPWLSMGQSTDCGLASSQPSGWCAHKDKGVERPGWQMGLQAEALTVLPACPADWDRGRHVAEQRGVCQPPAFPMAYSPALQTWLTHPYQWTNLHWGACNYLHVLRYCYIVCVIKPTPKIETKGWAEDEIIKNILSDFVGGTKSLLSSYAWLFLEIMLSCSVRAVGRSGSYVHLG